MSGILGYRITRMCIAVGEGKLRFQIVGNGHQHAGDLRLTGHGQGWPQRQ